MRVLGLDVGQKTIGVALTDEANIAAHPLTVLARAGNVADSRAVLALVEAHGVTDVVVGMPYELSGRIGHRARRVQELVAALRTTLGTTVLHEHDERFSTAEAERVLLAADVSRAKRRAVIDQQAASIILQAWLDHTRPR
jgi:putative holliday junction resolvase